MQSWLNLEKKKVLVLGVPDQIHIYLWRASNILAALRFLQSLDRPLHLLLCPLNRLCAYRKHQPWHDQGVSFLRWFEFEYLVSVQRLLTYDLVVNLISRLAFASVGLCLIFPSFLTNVRRQGANAEVLERLHFFSEMNEIRTACRLVYSICFVS